MGSCLFLMIAGLVYFMSVDKRDEPRKLTDRYKLASMFLPKTATLYRGTKITMAIFAVFAIIILVSRGSGIDGDVCG